MNACKIIVALVVTVVILAIAPDVVKQSNAPMYEADSENGLAVVDAIVSEPRLTCKYYVDSDFRRSVSNAKAAEATKGELLGGIVTHHLLADSLIAPFFSSISASRPEIVFIIGPNHKRLGSEKLNTGSWDWQTPFGVLEADDEAVESLVASCKAGANFELLELEHSISSLVSYVKYYMPEARLVPILLHGNYGLEASKELAVKIRKAAGNRRWIAIGSIDFSHYLTPEAAGKMDEITLKAMETGDLGALSRMGNDNLDSPPSVMTLLSIMKNEGDYEMKVTGHSNSSEIAGKYSDSTTSYFTMLFYKK